tara:strand:+ start:19438 stop:19950 length:513 start_codon:yes stop_codon:yes gene_type:complete
MNHCAKETVELRVAFPKGMQHATLPSSDATTPATTHATISLKALANQVIDRNRQCNNDATLANKLRNFEAKNHPQKLHLQNCYSGFSLRQIRELAGSDWQELKAEPIRLEVFGKAMRQRLLMCRGDIPEHYTKTVHCQHCGEVKLWEGCADTVLGCPWCLTNKKGNNDDK